MRDASPAGTGRHNDRAGPGSRRHRSAFRPGQGQVRIRLEGCGVCASNVAPWAGPDWMRFPTEPGALGHEGWGIVDAVGEGVPAEVGSPIYSAPMDGLSEWRFAEDQSRGSLTSPSVHWSERIAPTGPPPVPSPFRMFSQSLTCSAVYCWSWSWSSAT